jgi:hypothetical protein
MSVRRTAALTLVLAAIPLAVAGQSVPTAQRGEAAVAVLTRVSDRATGEPISSARVFFVLATEGYFGQWDGTARDDGTVVTPQLRLGTYDVRVEMLGYSDVVDRVALQEAGDVDLRIEMVPEAVALEPIVVAVRRTTRLETQGFFERRAAGGGYFLTRQDIESRNPFRVADVFYAVPGARVQAPRRGEVFPRVLLRGDCVPLIVLDGTPISIPILLDELLQISEVEAIEVYHGASAPLQFTQFSTCGTIVVWTREARLMEGKPFSWKRLLAAGGIVGALLFLTR